jgi:hypothetical protein
MKFKVIQALIEEGLPDAWTGKKVGFFPGPDDPDQPVDLMVVGTVAGGLGLQLDGALDNVSWQIRVSGNQNLYADAEQLAEDIDRVFMSFVPGQRIEGLLIVSIYRVGGPPSHLAVDDAERTQFVCSYYFDVESGLPPI